VNKNEQENTDRVVTIQPAKVVYLPPQHLAIAVTLIRTKYIF